MTEAVLDQRPLRADIFAAVERLRATGELDGSGAAWLALPGPKIEPRSLLALLGSPAAAGEPDAVVWENADESYAGWGVGCSIRVNGDHERFKHVRREIASFPVRSYECDGDRIARVTSSGPRWFGGFAFEDGPVGEASPWSGFGAAWFVLPRISIRVVDGRAQWSVVIDAAEAERPAEAEAVTLLSWLWDRIEAGFPTATEVAAPDSGRSSPTAPGAFADSIRSAVQSIRRGDLEKVVAASHVDVDLEQSPALDALMASWSEGAMESTRFLFRRRGEAFLGATPERLVRKIGRRVTTSALAGTAPKEAVQAVDGSGTDETASGTGRRIASQLLASAKNRSEHDFVVRHLVERLEPLSSSLRVSDELSILELRDLLHLQTPIEADLREDRHVLDLVEALHPTPAVCGFPTASARRWIQSHEDVRRGWYSGPVGWLDAAGNGDFQVALRSMLLSTGDEESPSEVNGYGRARLYAGVGLVQDSKIPEEMEEVDAKLLTAGRALGPWIRSEQQRLVAATGGTGGTGVAAAAASAGGTTSSDEPVAE